MKYFIKYYIVYYIVLYFIILCYDLTYCIYVSSLWKQYLDFQLYFSWLHIFILVLV